jgi:Flp pilus assembly protein TadD
VTGGKPITPVFGAVCLCCALVLAGCQTTETVNVHPTLSPSLETSYIESNDPGRLGRAHFASGNFAMAERHFRDAVEKNPLDADSWVGLAASYDNLKRFDLADRAYDQAVNLNGETVQLINNKGYSLFLRGNLGAARAAFDRALALDPGNEMVQNNLRLLLLRKPHVTATPL